MTRKHGSNRGISLVHGPMWPKLKPVLIPWDPGPSPSSENADVPDAAENDAPENATETFGGMSNPGADLGKCPDCGAALIETMTFDRFLNLECPQCGRCLGCRPSTEAVTERFEVSEECPSAGPKRRGNR